MHFLIDGPNSTDGLNEPFTLADDRDNAKEENEEAKEQGAEEPEADMATPEAAAKQEADLPNVEDGAWYLGPSAQGELSASAAWWERNTRGNVQGEYTRAHASCLSHSLRN